MPHARGGGQDLRRCPGFRVFECIQEKPERMVAAQNDWKAPPRSLELLPRQKGKLPSGLEALEGKAAMAFSRASLYRRCLSSAVG